MRKALFSCLAVMFVFLSSSLSAHYVSVHFGTDYGHLTNESNSGQKVGFKTGATYGIELGSGFRSEFEWCYRKNPFKKNDSLTGDGALLASLTRKMSSHSYMGNLIYDIAKLGYANITPYIGAGVGYSQHSYTLQTKLAGVTQSNTDHDNGFVYQGIVGVKYPMTDTVDVFTAYNYFVGRAHQKNHSVALSLAKNF